ncbi:MAG: hypothetical protein K8R35_10655 [Bacteroidales bacterium]|nr:hypothetical protein [Bacteroidales bacterium]
MQYLDFRKALEKFPIFSNSDIFTIDTEFDRRRLVEWQRKGYIRKIRNGIYYFTDYPVSEAFLYYTSNRLHKPSYISLETAMSYYNLIPEGVYLVTSISTKKSISYKTPLGNFSYRNVKPGLFFGYKLVTIKTLVIRIAEPEKMILDYLYFFRPDNVQTIESLRINKEVAGDIINFDRFDRYLAMFDSVVMNKRAKQFKNYLYA